MSVKIPLKIVIDRNVLGAKRFNLLKDALDSLGYKYELEW